MAKLFVDPDAEMLKPKVKLKNIQSLIDSGVISPQQAKNLPRVLKNSLIEFEKSLSDSARSAINISVQKEFLRKFTHEMQKAIEADPVFRNKTREIYEKQLKPILDENQKIVFIDSGMKGTIPALLCALVDIYSGKNYLAPDYRSPVLMYIFSIENSYFDPILHFTQGRDIGKPIEDAGKLGALSLDNHQVEIIDTGPKSKILAIIDLYNLKSQIQQKSGGN